mmetsp:Transcript_33894/g.84323  ORF Transcript_33894/g.84323 Transcript_33894/m.84323 type:complete len:117 (+) Transcript_33894:109-459(+)
MAAAGALAPAVLALAHAREASYGLAAGLAEGWGALIGLAEQSMPAWLFAAVQTVFIVALTAIIFVCAVCVAWGLLWKLVLSKIRFVVALKDELLLGQPSRPAAQSRRRARSPAHAD